MNHKHRWVLLRPGFPQRICRCGAIKALALQVGEHSISLSPAGDVIRWSASQAALAKGDIGMDVSTGRPRAFVLDADQLLALAAETFGFEDRRMWGIQQNSGLTTLSQLGFITAPTIEGTASVLDVAGGAQFINYLTAAVINSDGGWLSSAFSQTRFDYRPIYDAVVQTGSDITSIRHWIGLFSADPMASSAPAVSLMAFRYDTGADGTAFWRTVTNSGGVPTVTVTTTAIAVSTSYRLMIVVDSAGANVRFYINGALVSTHTLTLPAAATNLGHVEEARTLVAVARNFAISRVFCSQKAA